MMEHPIIFSTGVFLIGIGLGIIIAQKISTAIRKGKP